MSLIELKDISFSYRAHDQVVPILNSININIKEGEFVAIQGPSGSGKSTLLYLLGCLLKPQVGSVRIAGKNISNLNPDELSQLRNKEIGYVFQQFHLLPKTSILTNILLPTLYAKRPLPKALQIKRAEALAEELGLGARVAHTPSQLSGGQQQRVAIARALINDPKIILADEPTGNLDSKSSEQIMDLFRELNRKGKTIVVITHDNSIAEKCDRVIHVIDGQIVGEEQSSPTQSIEPESSLSSHEAATQFLSDLWTSLQSVKEYVPLALANLSRNKTRTLLTMLGISVGIAAVLSMVTLGQFTKKKILAGYAELGVNTLMFRGSTNWEQKATDVVPVSFKGFSWENDLVPLKRVFPAIQRMSPMMLGWDGTVSYGGRSVDQDVRRIGISEEGLAITKREFFVGRNFNLDDIENKKAVCILGHELGQKLFSSVYPVGQVVTLSLDKNSTNCTVVGVLKFISSNKEWMKANTQIILPFTFFQATNGEWWSSQIRDVMLELNPSADIETTGKGIRSYFEQKYGASGEFRANNDSVLVSQMQKFLSLFTVLLGAIALVTLAVGGIGITNMMLVSVSERFREIGLRKAVGATDQSIRTQFLAESLTVCALAGVVGLVGGFTVYHAAIFAATKFVKNLSFEWIVDPTALFLSVFSIFVVGVISGIFPALKAEKLQVIEALRSE